MISGGIEVNQFRLNLPNFNSKNLATTKTFFLPPSWRAVKIQCERDT